MTRINLLPWRAARRKERQRQFISVAVSAVILAGLVVFYAHLHIGGLIQHQENRNDFLRAQINKLEDQIQEIEELQAAKGRLLARMEVIQRLQSDRPRAVHLLDEIAHNVPEGVYLTRVRQRGNRVDLEGVARSNARVSALMRNVERSGWLADPELDIIETRDRGQLRTSTFGLKVRQIEQAQPEDEL